MITEYTSAKEMEEYCCVEGIASLWPGRHGRFCELRMLPRHSKVACHPKLMSYQWGPTVAPSALWWASFVCIHERRMVDQKSASWNQIANWLRQLDLVRASA